MALPVTFAGLTQATGANLDSNFAAVSALGIVPCTVAGTNALVMTPTPGAAATISAYADGQRVAAIAVATNTGATTSRTGALAVLNIYKDSPAGPVALSGGEIVIGCAFTLLYNAALNSGAGGFHLFSNTSYAGGTVTQLTLTRLLVGASAASVTRILSASGTLTFTVVPANTNQMQTLAVPGAQVNDVVSVGPPASVVAGTSFMGHVLAAGTIGVTAINSTAASLTPLGGIYRVAVTGFT